MNCKSLKGWKSDIYWEILKHWINILSISNNSIINITIKILTGSTKTAERKIIHEALENGTLDILIGTHALLEDKVQFHNLGLAIIDEQHRFGVAQRAKLWNKILLFD